MEGQVSGLTKENPALLAAEETLVDMKYAVDRAKEVILEAERDSRVVSKCLSVCLSVIFTRMKI